MYHYLLIDTSFYNSLLALDKLIAEQVKQVNCQFCQANLNQSHYSRKPKGVPAGLDDNYSLRFSYCCAREGCRKRFTPPSMRFLSRKVYCSVVIIVIFLLSPQSDESRIDKFNQLLGTELSVETLRRWRRYWVKTVTQSHTFKRAAFVQDLSPSLPSSLLNLFQQDEKSSLKMGLKWLLPLTAGVHLFDVPFQLTIF